MLKTDVKPSKLLQLKWKLLQTGNILFIFFENLYHSNRLYGFLLGAMLTFAFAPFNALPVVIISFTGLLHFISKARSNKSAFWLGWWFGYGYFLTSLYWIYNSLLVELSSFWWVIPFCIFGIPLYLAFYIAPIALVTHFFSYHPIKKILAFSSTWVVMELIRSYLFIPFPWNLLGNALNASNELLQSIHIIGIFGASFFIALFGSCFYTRNYKLIASLLLIISITWACGSWKLTNSEVTLIKNYKVRIVQPSFTEFHMGQTSTTRENLRKLAELSIMNRPHDVKYVIWHEAAYPYMFESGKGVEQNLGRLAPKHGALITGIDRHGLARDLSGDHFFNSMIVIGGNGEELAAYDKEQLVPFGEYIPFKSSLSFLKKITHGLEDFTSGKNLTKNIEVLDLPKFLPLICYEIIFPDLDVEDDTKWLLNITNDAWFGDSIGPYQHLAMARVKAVEYGLPLVRVANNGISVVIDQSGNILHRMNLNQLAIIDFYLPIHDFKNYLYFKWLFKILPFIIISMLLTLKFALHFKKK